jgi:hypothetical protein
MQGINAHLSGLLAIKIIAVKAFFNTMDWWGIFPN